MRCDVNISVRRESGLKDGVSAPIESVADRIPDPVFPDSREDAAMVEHFTGSRGVPAGDAAIDGVSAALSDAEEFRASSLGYWVWGGVGQQTQLPVTNEAPYGPRVELKNLASIRAVESGVDAEARRQIALLEAGCCVLSETRSFDVATGVTTPARLKEGEADYRFMREPDLRPLLLSEAFVKAQVAALPELPDTTVRRLASSYSLSTADAAAIVNEGAVSFFEATLRHTMLLLKESPKWRKASIPDTLTHEAGAVVSSAAETDSRMMQQELRGIAKATANWMLNELCGQLARLGSQQVASFTVKTKPTRATDDSATIPGIGEHTLATCRLAPEFAGELLACVLAGDVSARVAKDVLAEMLSDLQTLSANTDTSPVRTPRAIIAERGWGQLNNITAIRTLCESAAADPALASSLAKYRNGNDRVLGVFVARAIESSGGIANPVLVAQMMVDVIGPAGTAAGSSLRQRGRADKKGDSI